MRWLLKLYPRSWRERYEEEMRAVLEEHPITPATVIDLIFGAVDANLNYNRGTGGMTSVVNQLRSGIVMIFCAFMLFGVGWAMLQRITDPLNAFQTAASYHPGLRVLFNGIFLVGCLAFAAFFVGGVPVFLLSVWRAFKNGRRDVLIPFWIAVSSLFVFTLATCVVTVWRPHGHIIALILGYLALLALLLVVGTVAVSLIVARTEFRLSELKLLFVPEVIIVFGMVVSVVLSTALNISIVIHAPMLFDTQDVSSQMFITGLILMSLGTIFAWIGLQRTTAKNADPAIHM